MKRIALALALALFASASITSALACDGNGVSKEKTTAPQSDAKKT